MTKIFTTPTFNRYAKKLHPNEKISLDKATRNLVSDPTIGEVKRGDLSDIYIYKYKVKTQLWLLAYTIESDVSITLRLVGPHENFYRDLKR